LGDEDESLADDLPASAVYIHLESASKEFVVYLPGLIKLTGTLQFGAQQEPDGRVSTVRLLLDRALTKELVQETAGNASQPQAVSAVNVENEVATKMKSQQATPKKSQQATQKPLPTQHSNNQEKQI
jgi:hypothetical protein